MGWCGHGKTQLTSLPNMGGTKPVCLECGETITYTGLLRERRRLLRLLRSAMGEIGQLETELAGEGYNVITRAPVGEIREVLGQ